MASAAAAAADGSAAAASSTAAAASASAPLPSLGPVSESSTAWRYEGWLHSFPLNHATVLDYFKHSDFYDRTCNNEVALMQTMHADSLKLMEGIEYSVDPSPSEDFWLIRKSYRADPQTTQLLSLYLVVGADGAALGDPQFPPRGTVFPMPDLHSVLKTNVATGLHYLTEAFDELNAHAQFHPAVHGYQWNFPPDEVKNADTAAASSISVDTAVQPRNQFANLIDNAILKISHPIQR